MVKVNPSRGFLKRVKRQMKAGTLSFSHNLLYPPMSEINKKKKEIESKNTRQILLLVNLISHFENKEFQIFTSLIERA